jgi:hypothetical protein
MCFRVKPSNMEVFISAFQDSHTRKLSKGPRQPRHERSEEVSAARRVGRASNVGAHNYEGSSR